VMAFVGTYLVAQRSRSTLVLVHRQPLLDQWVAQLFGARDN
jgi:superfamily II DNA or RNA helicase